MRQYINLLEQNLNEQDMADEVAYTVQVVDKNGDHIGYMKSTASLKLVKGIVPAKKVAKMDDAIQWARSYVNEVNVESEYPDMFPTKEHTTIVHKVYMELKEIKRFEA